MKYADGAEIRRGDRIRIFGVQLGVVVFSVDAGEYSNEFPEAEWAYLKSGVMVKAENGALIHLDDSNTEGMERIP
jgi:hypothetical protein